MSTFLSWSLTRALFWVDHSQEHFFERSFDQWNFFEHFFEDSKKWICSQECFFEWVCSFEGFFECSKKHSRSNGTFMPKSRSSTNHKKKPSSVFTKFENLNFPHWFLLIKIQPSCNCFANLKPVKLCLKSSTLPENKDQCVILFFIDYLLGTELSDFTVYLHLI